MFDHLGNSFLWLLMAYSVVTIIGIIHMYIFHLVFKVPNAKQAGTIFLKSPAYVKTIPYQALYNVVIFPIFLWFYMQGFPLEQRETLMFATVVQWTVLSMLMDYVGWVLIPHKYRFTHKEFYVDYQPWITLIYLAILVSHYIVKFFI